MILQELISILQQYDKNTEVLISSDAEGNTICKLGEGCISNALYDPMSGYSVDIYSPDDAEEYEDLNLEPCVIIYPIN